ncbi:MAG: hypothetical protein ACTHK0_13850 [Ginsengibacter sp.]
MFEALYKYLILNGRLGFPGMGSLIIENLPVEHDFAHKKIYPPLPVIRWQADMIAPDQQFYKFIASDLALNEVNAIGQFNDFTYQLKETIAQKGMAELPGIGKLKKEFANTYSFDPAYSLNDYFQPVTAEYVNPQNNQPLAEEEPADISLNPAKARRLKEKPADANWWIYALILALLGIAGLIYHYMV